METFRYTRTDEEVEENILLALRNTVMAKQYKAEFSHWRSNMLNALGARAISAHGPPKKKQ